MNTEIKTEKLGHFFGTHEVLKNINLEIREGEIFGLLGPSGAGKTTLINILTGQLSPSKGSAEILGKETTGLCGNDYMQMGIMMDNFGLYDRMSCYDNLKFYDKLKALELLSKLMGLFDGKSFPEQQENNLLEEILKATREEMDIHDIPELQQTADAGDDLVEQTSA